MLDERISVFRRRMLLHSTAHRRHVVTRVRIGRLLRGHRVPRVWIRCRRSSRLRGHLMPRMRVRRGRLLVHRDRRADRGGWPAGASAASWAHGIHVAAPTFPVPHVRHRQHRPGVELGHRRSQALTHGQRARGEARSIHGLRAIE